MSPILSFILTILLPILSTAHPGPPKPTSTPIALVPQPLNVTTITANAQKKSVLECWSVSPLQISATPGIQGALLGRLAAPSALNYFVIPAGFQGGLHNAPVVQWVYFTGGKAVVSLPDSPETATIIGGAEGLILAADTANVSTVGHFTDYPSKDLTVGLTIPVAGNEVPEHTVLHMGPCTAVEQSFGA
ncbi:MAG: hypothetical protein Q9219_003944 [cf. Caloplaca sp. 3 TL-2023]